MIRRAIVPSSKIFEKKVPENPRYADVSSKVNSHNQKVTIVTEKMIVKRREEVFTRISARGLMEELCKLHDDDESVYDLATESKIAAASAPKSDAKSLIYGGFSDDTASTVVKHAADATSAADHSELLLLDIREAEEFQKGHIRGATSHPMSMLMRDRITANMHKHKTEAPGRMLIIYGLDDKASAAAATTYVMKGWPLVYVLSGGFEKFAELSPELVDGELPVQPGGSPGRSVKGSRATASVAGTSVSAIHRGSVHNAEPVDQLDRFLQQANKEYAKNGAPGIPLDRRTERSSVVSGAPRQTGKLNPLAGPAAASGIARQLNGAPSVMSGAGRSVAGSAVSTSSVRSGARLAWAGGLALKQQQAGAGGLAPRKF